MRGSLLTGREAIVQNTLNERTELLKSLPPRLSKDTATMARMVNMLGYFRTHPDS